MSTRRKVLILLLILWTMGVTLLRALRKPNDFSEAHWLLGYQLGFVKRGLVGEVLSRVCSWLSFPLSDQLILVLSSIAFAMFCLAILILVLRILEKLNWSQPAVLAVFVFASSPYLVMSAHLFGYFDNLIILLGICSILLLAASRPWTGAVLQALAMFVHEGALLITFPLFCVAWLLKEIQRRRSGAAMKSCWPLLLPLVAFLVVSIGHTRSMSPGYVERSSAYLAQYDYIQHNCELLVPQWMETSFGKFMAIESPYFGARLGGTLFHGIALPTTLALLCLIFVLFRVRPASMEALLLFVVCFAPQCMHIIACDTERIWSYTMGCSFLALWIYTECVQPDDLFLEVQSASPQAPTEMGLIHGSAGVSCVCFLCLLVLLVNIVTITPLMDLEEERFNLKWRGILYAPSLLGALTILLTERGTTMHPLFTIQGSNFFSLLFPFTRAGKREREPSPTEHVSP